MNLANVPALTTAYQIGLTWVDGVHDGGSPILDYRINYRDEFQSEFSIYQEATNDIPFTVTGLTPGVTYVFKVEARNLVGFSEYSNEVTILAA